MNGLIKKLIRSMGMKWVTQQIRSAAEGKLGEPAHRIYWSLAGKKRWISLGFFLASGIVAYYANQTAGEILAGVATVGLAGGVIDANWRDESDYDWLKSSAVWKLLAENSPLLTTALVAGLAWLHGDACTLGAMWCSYGAVGVTVLGCCMAQVGMVDAAWNAPAPKIAD